MTKKTIGIERERFIADSEGRIVSAIGTLLPEVWKEAGKQGVPEDLFTYELFAGQIEDRILPCRSLDEARESLLRNDRIMSAAASRLGLAYDYSEAVEADRIASLEVNPFDARHKQIWQSISPERRLSASIVAAVHVHISAAEDEAVRILNVCRPNVVDSLIRIGDHSGFRRINAYRGMAQTDGVPPVFSEFSGLMDYIGSKGGEKNVWDLVRYKPSTKTVEFRMFGATQSVDEAIGYVNACCELIGVRI